MLKIQKMLKKIQNQKGAAKIEYVLLVALISVVSITVLTNIGTSVEGKFNAVNTGLQ